jgi:hypothetical protein
MPQRSPSSRPRKTPAKGVRNPGSATTPSKDKAIAGVHRQMWSIVRVYLGFFVLLTVGLSLANVATGGATRQYTYWLWGGKRDAIFDLWSYQHLLSGISYGGTLRQRLPKESILQRLTIALAVSCAWESMEHYLETGLAGAAVEHWFQGVEAFGNRCITDSLMVVSGFYVAHFMPHLIATAGFVKYAWLAIHVFLFDHSMVLQHWLDNDPTVWTPPVCK